MRPGDIDRHLLERTALLDREKASRRDHGFKSSMSPTAQKAAGILSAIRERESKSFWMGPHKNNNNNNNNNNHNKKENEDVLFPGMSFALSRSRIKETALWKIISAMPKGCLLHAHMEAMIDTHWLVDQALEIPGFFISSTQALPTNDDRWVQPFQFHYRPGMSVQQHGASIWDTTLCQDDRGYAPGDLVPVHEAARTHPGGTEGFKQWAIARMTINRDEALQHHHGIDEIWKKFTGCFQKINGLFYTEPVLRRCIPRLLRQLHRDGISYVELRMVPNPFYREGSATPDADHTYFFQCFEQEVRNYIASPAGEGFWGARIIWTAMRRLSDEIIKESMLDCLTCKERFPALIAGFDFVGQEDLGRPLVDLVPLAKWFQAECTARNLQIPFFLHAGECLGDGDSTDSNLVDAILLNARRIGHGFSLYKHPLLIDLVKAKKILIEMCPISHEVLRLTSNILMHPMPALHARGVPVSLNNDDPAVLGYGANENGLSMDFYQVFLAFGNTGLGGLAAMAEDSIRWAALQDQSEEKWLQGIEGREDQLKGGRIEEWRAAFEAWCLWIVQEFSVEVFQKTT